MLDINQILSKPLAETFTVMGVAPNVVMAHTLAWQALEDSLGIDPLSAWQLKGMQHVHSTEPKGVAFTAEFAREPDGGEA